jgi:predicted RNase H-like HicB family nuclease
MLDEQPDEVVYDKDGDKWRAHLKDFTNLQESPAGFGDTKAEAYRNLKVAVATKEESEMSEKKAKKVRKEQPTMEQRAERLVMESVAVIGQKFSGLPLPVAFGALGDISLRLLAQIEDFTRTPHGQLMKAFAKMLDDIANTEIAKRQEMEAQAKAIVDAAGVSKKTVCVPCCAVVDEGVSGTSGLLGDVDGPKLTIDPNGDDPEKWIEVESKVGLKLVEDEPESKTGEESIPAE